ncbi:MAG: hypothetical protein ACHQVS_02070 [Candidatus Babeliales bacterium]
MKVISICIMMLHGTLITAYNAIVTIPIADLVGSPLPIQHHSTVRAYQELPVCGATYQPFVACPRLHQALFNQQVEVIQERGDQVCVRIPNVFYVTHSNTHHNQFWMARSALTPITTVQNQKINLATFPRPIDAATKTVPEKDIVTLIEPFHDIKTGLMFSAGTRFVITQTKPSAHTFAVYRYDPARNNVGTMHIPKKSCTVIAPDCTSRERVRHYVTLARQWAIHTPDAIPYGWGCCSYIERSQPNNFTEIIKQKEGQSYSYYTRPDCSSKTKSGLDCSGLICLAAQCCGIPCFLKNSTTIAHCLHPVTSHEAIIEGDIIWIPKHVMIVGSLKHNTLIEARHYEQGYGYVQEIPLSAVFKGITTYQELYAACVHKKPLVRLDSEGTPRETIRECKILQIMSVWNT